MAAPLLSGQLGSLQLGLGQLGQYQELSPSAEAGYRDAIVILYLVPRATVAVVMPIAYVTAVNVDSAATLASPSTATIPITGSFATLVEGQSVPQNNQ